MTDHLVSVIIPTHNRIKALKIALESVRNQTWKNLEIIIIADGCIDGTINFIKEVGEYDKRIQFIENVVPQGGAQARNQGFSQAHGEYIGFLDDDDYWETTKIEKQLDFLIANPEFCMVSCNYLKCYDDRNVIVKAKKNSFNLEELKYNNMPGSFSFCMVDSKYLKNARILPTLTACQDWYLWILLLTNSNKKGFILEDVLCKYDATSSPGISNTAHRKISGHIYFFEFLKPTLNQFQVFAHRYLINKWKLCLLELSFTQRIITYLKMIFYKISSMRDINLVSLIKDAKYLIKKSRSKK